MSNHSGGRDLSPTELLAGIFCEDTNEPLKFKHVLPDFFSPTKTSVVDKIRPLLEAGVDPDVLTCAYIANNKMIHRLANVVDAANFLDGTFREFCTRSPPPHVCADPKQHWDNNMGANAKESLAYMYTPLVKAALDNDIGCVSLLIEYGARFNPFFRWTETVKGPWMRNPFMRAVVTKNIEFLNLLFKGVDSPHNTLHRWLGECMTVCLDATTTPRFDSTIADLLIRHGANLLVTRLPLRPTHEAIDYAVRRHFIRLILREEEPDILTAAILNNMELCKYVTTNKVDLAVRSKHGLDVLQIAAGNRDALVLDFLINLGAKVDSTDYDGMSPLLEAVYYGHLSAVQLFAAKGANPNDVVGRKVKRLSRLPWEDSFPLRGAWRSRRDAAVKIFKVKAWSALHIAAHRGLPTVVRALQVLGASNTYKDRDGCTALDITVQNSSLPMKSWLLVCDFLFMPNHETAWRLSGRKFVTHVIGTDVSSRIFGSKTTKPEHNVTQMLLCRGDLPPYRAEELRMLTLKILSHLRQRVSIEEQPVESSFLRVARCFFEQLLITLPFFELPRNG